MWSTDVNAHIWSGRVVVRAPAVQADRERPEDGAPPLLIRLPIPEAGVYTISLGGSQRPLALSLDGGKTWRRFTQGTIARMVDLPAGHFDVGLTTAMPLKNQAMAALSRLFSGQSLSISATICRIPISSR